MIKISQHSWLGGQLDYEMLGRQDIAKYAKGATTLRNFLPIRRGAIRKRPGTDYIANATSYIGQTGGVPNKFRLIPFAYLENNGFVLLMCDRKARAISETGQQYDVSGTIPYTADELNEISYVQCGDVLYIAHRNHPPAEIRHETATTFVYQQCRFGADGVPSPEIIRAKITRNQLGYDYRGGTVTDHYALSIVYERSDGSIVESKPYYMRDDWTEGAASETDSKKYGVATDEPSTYRKPQTETDQVNHVASWYGTTYFLPFTESQHIELQVNLPNTSMKIKQFRLYKDHGGAYGLCAVEGSRKFGNWMMGTHSSNVKAFSNVTFNNGTWSVKCKIALASTPSSSKYRIVTAAGNETDTEISLSAPADSTTNSFNLTITRDNLFAMIDNGITPDTSTQPLDDKDVFQPVDVETEPKNYPGCVSIYQQRLVWASSEKDPARVWMSATGDFYEYRPHVLQQADDPIDFILPITQFAEINHIIELGKLFAFTASSEMLIGSNSDVSGISFETIQATTQSFIGCKKRLPPIIANNSILVAERTGQTIRDFSFDISKNVYGGNDVSIFSSSIFNEKSIVDWTWQHQPNSTMWAVLSDGTIASLCYMTDQEVCAWATHTLGGNGIALAISKTCSIQGADADNPTTSTIMLAVQRGSTITIERMRTWARQTNDSIANMVTMDSVRSVAAGTEIPEGMTAIDKATGNKVTTIGANGAWVGYPFVAEMTSVYPAVSDNDIGAGQFDVKNVQQVSIRVINAVGGKIRAYDVEPERASELAVFNPDVALHVSNGNVLTPITDVRCIIAGSNNRDGRITLTQDEPWPFELISMETDIELEVGGQHD